MSNFTYLNVEDLKKFEIERESSSGKEFIRTMQNNMVPTVSHLCSMIRNAIFNGNNDRRSNARLPCRVFMLEGFPKNLRETAIFENEVCPIAKLCRFGPVSKTVSETTELESHFYNRSKMGTIEIGSTDELVEQGWMIKHNLALAVGPQSLVDDYVKGLGAKQGFECVSFPKVRETLVSEVPEETEDKSVSDKSVWERVRKDFLARSRSTVTVV